jgi:hypothetical protein
MQFMIVRRTEDGTTYYTGGRSDSWVFELENAGMYKTRKAALRKANALNDDEIYQGVAVVREV